MTNASGTIVYVDADACPVKEEVTTIAIRHGCRAVMVCNGGIRPHPHPLIDLAIVNDGPDAADIWIADHAGALDVVVGVMVGTSSVEAWGSCRTKLMAALISSVSEELSLVSMDAMSVSCAAVVDSASTEPSVVIETPGGSVAATTLSLLPEFSTSAAVPDCVEEVLVMTCDSTLV